MAVLMRAEIPGVTEEQFQVLFVPVIDQLKAFPGFLINASGPVPGGYQVTEVWESQDAHERWLREVIMPIGQQAGVGDLPPAQYAPIDRFFTR